MIIVKTDDRRVNNAFSLSLFLEKKKELSNEFTCAMIEFFGRSISQLQLHANRRIDSVETDVEYEKKKTYLKLKCMQWNARFHTSDARYDETHS